MPWPDVTDCRVPNEDSNEYKLPMPNPYEARSL